MKNRKTVVLGFYGSTLDSAHGAGRFSRWRPSYSLVSHEDLLVDRFEMWIPKGHKPRVLLEDMAEMAPGCRVNIHGFETADPWDFEEVYGQLLDFAQSYDFRPDEEDYLVHLTTGTHVAQICLFLLTEAGFFPARLVQSSPALAGYQRRTRKNPGFQGRYHIIDLDLSRYDALAARFEIEREARLEKLRGGIETKNTAMRALLEKVERVARVSKDPVLLSGETGVGKTRLARRIHMLRVEQGLVSGELVEVNCATLRGDLAMSTLFGHTKGAFTGATEKRRGLLAQAHGGTLFLDEIGELGLDEQAMLLAAIEDKRVMPLGGDSYEVADFQLIAGTNRDLRNNVAQATFREDLLARIDLWHFELLSLRERREDIEANVQFELSKLAAEQGRALRFGRDALAIYLRFAQSPNAKWTANFRDLSSSVRRLGTLAKGQRIVASDVADEIGTLNTRWQNQSERKGILQTFLSEQQIAELDTFDRMQLEAVLHVCAECTSLSEAGRRLFNVSRETKRSKNDADRIRKYLARFGIDGKATTNPVLNKTGHSHNS